MKDIEKDRAAYAYKAVEEGIKENNKYVVYLKKIPMLILNNGLLSALVFMYQKGDAYEIILERLIEWCNKMEKEMKIKTNTKVFNVGDVEETLRNVAGISQSQYRYCTKEILSLLVWMKRFGEGMAE